ncbi:hypothetical protein [Nocardiopsis aegyptia]|uniref:Uncharacterized protein n=1 Tax=Nocardiopsis aegyptia TaxID=220378 RepID=A0A7Z0EIQ5_9ACTN|nr:hypothetical protein [Nocardiopsis aegyptia]NYJ32819.1 hypothetical protein [Nocardiopsis aegyptia]
MRVHLVRVGDNRNEIRYRCTGQQRLEDSGDGQGVVSGHDHSCG